MIPVVDVFFNDGVTGNYFGQLSASAGLLVYVPFNENTGSIATDVSQGNSFTWSSGSGWGSPSNAGHNCRPGSVLFQTIVIIVDYHCFSGVANVSPVAAVID